MVATAPDIGIDVRLELVASRASLAVSGEVDIATAPDLGAVLNAVIDRNYRYLTVDLSEVSFLDAQGLRVLIEGGARLGRDGRLTVARPSQIVRRILEIAGVDEHLDISVDRAAAASARARPQRALPATRPEGSEASDAIIDAALQLLVNVVTTSFPAAVGTSVSLSRHGRLITVAAHKETVADLDSHQYSAGGPCVDASTHGQQCHAEDLERPTPWPIFAREARDHGIRSVLSSPLIVDGESLGALNIYSSSPKAFRPHDQQRAATFAAQASAFLANLGADPDSDDPAGA